MRGRFITDVLDRTARILAHRGEVKVVYRGNIISPHTDGKTIFLPTLPQPVPENMERVWHGLVDHETSHILFSDFDEISRFKKIHGENAFAILNVAEDLRCEAMMAQEYPGSAENLTQSYEYAMKRWSKAIPTMPLYNRVIGCLIATGQGRDTSIFGEDAEQVVAVVKDLVLMAPHAPSTQAAAEIALQIIERLKSRLDELNEQPALELTPLIEDFLHAPPNENLFTLSELFGEILREASGEGADRPYRVYTYENDVIQTAPNLSSEAYHRSLEEVRPLVSGLRQRLIMTLQGRSKKRLVPSDEGVKLNRKRLHTICLDSPSSPFMKKVEAPSNDIAVMLLVDQSGSMRGKRIELAKACSILLAETMDQLHFPLSIVGFTTTHDRSYLSILRQNELQPIEQIETEFTRYIPLQYIVYKDFKESLRQCRGRFECMTAQHYTPLNEAIIFGGKKLMSIKASRHLLLILTDGAVFLGNKDTQPIAERNLHDNLEHLKRAGIEVLAIGIQTSFVKEVFAESIVVDELSQLPQQFYRTVAGKFLR